MGAVSAKLCRKIECLVFASSCSAREFPCQGVLVSSISATVRTVLYHDASVMRLGSRRNCDDTYGDFCEFLPLPTPGSLAFCHSFECSLSNFSLAPVVHQVNKSKDTLRSVVHDGEHHVSGMIFYVVALFCSELHSEVAHLYHIIWKMDEANTVVSGVTSRLT